MNWKFWQPAKQAIEKWLIGTAAAPFNSGAIPESPADGITVDRLISILRDAKTGNADDLLALYADIICRDVDFIAGGLQRKAPLVARKLNATVPAKSSPELVRNRDFVRAALARMKGKIFGVAHLLDGAYWPLAVVEKIIARAPSGSGRMYDVVELREVPFWRLTFRADNNGPAGTLKIKKLRPDGMLDGQETEPPSSAKYIVHRGHLHQSLPDCWGGPMRAVVFWWYFGNWARQACARHLEKTNMPKWIAKAPQANWKAAKKELQRAFNNAVNTDALIVPEDAKIEAISTMEKDGVESFIAFMALCSKQIAKVVLVQTMTMEGQPQGIGGTQANVQQDALNSVQDFDAVLLGETLKEQLYRPILELSGMAGGVPDATWGEDDDSAKVKIESLGGLYEAGLEPADEALPLIGDIVGYAVRRRVMAAPPAPGLSGFSAGRSTHDELHAALDALAENVAGDLAEAFGADSAQLAHALRTATGPADLMRRAQLATAGLAPHRSARLMEDILAAATANGLICSHRTAGQS